MLRRYGYCHNWAKNCCCGIWINVVFDDRALANFTRPIYRAGRTRGKRGRQEFLTPSLPEKQDGEPVQNTKQPFQDDGSPTQNSGDVEEALAWLAGFLRKG